MKKILSAIALCLFCMPASAKLIGLNTANTVVIRGEVSISSMTQAQLDLMEQLNKRHTKTYPIYLVLDTPGGSIIAGETFIEMAKLYKNVETISIYAASMGSAIVQAIPGKRWVLPSGMLMFHRAKGQFVGQFESGEVESRLNFFKSYVRDLEWRNANRLGLKLKDYKDKVKDEWWVSGQRAVDAKVADEVAHIFCSKKLVDKKVTSRVAGLFGSSTQIFSGCPLIRAPLPNLEE